MFLAVLKSKPLNSLVWLYHLSSFIFVRFGDPIEHKNESHRSGGRRRPGKKVNGTAHAAKINPLTGYFGGPAHLQA